MLKRSLFVAVVVGLVAAVYWSPVAASAVPRSTTTHRCFGFYPGGEDRLHYAEGCYGHDEPMLNPESSTSGSAQDITWTFVLPKDGTTSPNRTVIDLGPTFWLGATVKDTASLASQGELEVQFYPDSNLSGCTSNGGFNTSFSANVWTSCMPVWAVNPSTFNEYAAFNHMLNRSGTTSTPLVMHAGDTISARIYVSSGHYNVFVKDVTTGQQSAVIPLVSSTDGALTNSYTTNVHTNYLRWGGIQNSPLSMAWEIGHPNIYTYPNAPACYPGMFNCFSYNVTNGWQKVTPLQIKSVIFKNSSSVQPTSWSTVDGQGGSAEDIDYCGTYNNPASGGSCTFPWYSYDGTAKAIDFGGQYPNTTFPEGTYTQFATAAKCTNSPYGFSIYCATTMPNKPPIP